MSTGRNLPLRIGAMLVALAALIALIGPLIAPRDPLVFNYVAFAGDSVLKPPFAPFAAPDFPLGSDPFGRDMLSQLLWAIRPTLVFMSLVAGLRMLLGAAIGALAGWSDGRAGRLADLAIRIALVAPTLLVALATIAALAGRLSAAAFVIGLVVTAWAEPARLFREEMALTRAQAFIEAGRAIGLSEGELLRRHGWRQLTPLIWQTLAFEMANTLMSIAALGFLGYYIGGIQWIMVSDFTARRISGAPELGQMLGVAAASELRATPWALLLIGGVVAAITLGFNLLGEGLRRRAEALRRSNGAVAAFVETQLTERLRRQAANASARRRLRLRIGIALGALALIVAGLLLADARARAGRQLALPVPGGQFWSGERRDPSGTLTSPLRLPAVGAPRQIHQGAQPWAGGPALDDRGRILLPGAQGRVVALDAAGKTLWETVIGKPLVGAPAFSQSGAIFVLDREGGVTTLSSTGDIQQRYAPPAPREPLGPGVVSADGVFFYAVDGELFAIAGGRQRWRAPIPYTFFSPTPRLSADGRTVFFKDMGFDATTGQTLIAESAPYLDQFVIGADGVAYLYSDTALLAFERGEQLTFRPRAKLAVSRQLPQAPQDLGVTAAGRLWLSIGGPFNNNQTLGAFDATSGAFGGSTTLALRGGRVVAVDADGVLVTCGQAQAGAVCTGVRPGAAEPEWQVTVGPFVPVGAALGPAGLIVTGNGGEVFVIPPAGLQ
ncbi:MAG: PQQ-binding-like beta-propeller repeat protein [Thermoflexales bacterium]|nr:PQQ-binding-like beta-propeller repeat protein [Thermoflexales bacterium]